MGFQISKSRKKVNSKVVYGENINYFFFFILAFSVPFRNDQGVCGLGEEYVLIKVLIYKDM